MEQQLLPSLKKGGELATLTELFSGVGAVASVDLAMSYLSRPFYLRQLEQRNTMVDGRQMGTAVIHPTAQIAQQVFIGEQVKIAQEVTLYPGVVIMGHCQIGAGTVIYPNVSLAYDVVIGEDCRIHSNTVIGGDGFGYHYHQGVHHKVWHLGGVVVGNGVEIGANCTINGGTFKNTMIGDGSKLDSAVHVAHNCVVGKAVVLCGQVALAGSVEVGDGTVCGGRVAVESGGQMGPGCQVAAFSGVMGRWPAGSKLGGFPAQAHGEWLRELVVVKKLVKQYRASQRGKTSGHLSE